MPEQSEFSELSDSDDIQPRRQASRCTTLPAPYSGGHIVQCQRRGATTRLSLWQTGNAPHRPYSGKQATPHDPQSAQ